MFIGGMVIGIIIGMLLATGLFILYWGDDK